MTAKAYEYYGREGRRIKGRYQMVHVIRVNGTLHEVTAATKEKAIELALNEEGGQ